MAKHKDPPGAGHGDDGHKPGGDGGDIVKKLIAAFKTLFGVDANTFLTLGAVPMRKAVEKIAKDLRENLPVDHWLRGDMVETIINLFASRVEAASEKLSGAPKAVLEKLSDAIEEFAGVFCGGEKDSSHEKEKAHKADPHKTAQAFKEVNDKFMESARARLQAASGSEKAAVIAQIKLEATALAELKVLMMEGVKEKEEPKAEKPKVSFRERIEKLVSEPSPFEPLIDPLQQIVAERENKQAFAKALRIRSRTLFDKISVGFWKLLGIKFN